MLGYSSIVCCSGTYEI